MEEQCTASPASLCVCMRIKQTQSRQLGTYTIDTTKDNEVKSSVMFMEICEVYSDTKMSLHSITQIFHMFRLNKADF